MVQKHRVLVLYRQSLFTQALQRLLEQAGEFEVTGADLDAADPVVCLRQVKPDAVVLDADDLCTAGAPLLTQLLRDTPSVQVVCLTALDGRVDVYHRDPLPVQRYADLLHALRSSELSERQGESGDALRGDDTPC